MIFFVIFLVIAVIVVGIVLASLAASKHRNALRQVALANGLQFSHEYDYSYDERYPFLKKLCQGSSRYAFNVMQGNYRGHPVILFDYHYETHSRDSKGRRKTQHHYFSFFILNFNQDFPELIIAREGWMSKVAQFFGYDDIDFESAAFSRQFIVRSKNKKFAYDICHARMIETMLQNPDLSIEIERNCLTLFFHNRLTPQLIEPNLQRLVQVRELFPKYIMER